MGRTIPRKDADFNVWQDVIATTTETNREKCHIDNDWLNSLFLLGYSFSRSGQQIHR